MQSLTLTLTPTSSGRLRQLADSLGVGIASLAGDLLTEAIEDRYADTEFEEEDAPFAGEGRDAFPRR